jgi:hypothetical protein
VGVSWVTSLEKCEDLPLSGSPCSTLNRIVLGKKRTLKRESLPMVTSHPSPFYARTAVLV